MSGQWSYRPERAPECMNGRYKCDTYECVKLLKHAGQCMACRKLAKLAKPQLLPAAAAATMHVHPE